MPYQNQTRNELVVESMEKLKGNVGRAVDELISLLESSNDEVKRKSANDVINLALKWREFGEVEQRLESIEQIILERRHTDDRAFNYCAANIQSGRS